MRELIASMAACLALAGCAKTEIAACGGPDAAGQRMRDVIDADNARDLPRVLTYYTDDVRWLPPKPREPMEGIAAIRASYESMYSTFFPALTITVESAALAGEGARVTGRTGGRLRPQAGGEDTIVNDAYDARLRCERGEWRIESMAWDPAGS